MSKFYLSNRKMVKCLASDNFFRLLMLLVKRCCFLVGFFVVDVLYIFVYICIWMNVVASVHIYNAWCTSVCSQSILIGLTIFHLDSMLPFVQCSIGVCVSVYRKVALLNYYQHNTAPTIASPKWIQCLMDFSLTKISSSSIYFVNV